MKDPITKDKFAEDKLAEGKIAQDKFAIDAEVVKRMAKLAHLQLTENQIQGYANQMASIMKYFEEISAIDTTDIEPMVTPIEIQAEWRADVVTKEFTAEQMVANAPMRSGNLFKVPPVV